MGGNTSSQVADPASANFVNEQVSNNCVLIFSKTYCPYCRSVKQLFQNLGVTPAVIELDKMQDGPSIQAVLGQMTGATTVSFVPVTLSNNLLTLVKIS